MPIQRNIAVEPEVWKDLKNGFIVLYSDIIFDSETIKDLLKEKGEIVLAIKKNGLREEAEKVVEQNGIVKSVSKMGIEGEDPEYIGLSKFSKEGAGKIIEEMHDIGKTNINATIIRTLERLIINGQKVKSYDIGDSKFIDIDFPEDIKNAEKFI